MKQVKCVKGNRVLRPQASGFYFHRKNDDIEGRQLAVETVRRKDNGGSKSEGRFTPFVVVLLSFGVSALAILVSLDYLTGFSFPFASLMSWVVHTAIPWLLLFALNRLPRSCFIETPRWRSIVTVQPIDFILCRRLLLSTLNRLPTRTCFLSKCGGIHSAAG